MAQSFNQIPSNLRTPFMYTEFDGSNAVTGAQKQPFKVLLIGQKLPTGSKEAGVIGRVISKIEGRNFYGEGSMLSDMIDAYIENNKFIELFCLAINDEEAGVQAKASINFGGAPTVAGTAIFRVLGKRVAVGVISTDTPSSLATKLVAALAEIKQVTAQVDEAINSKVIITYKHKGALGNELDVRQGYYADEKGLPLGLTAAIVNFAGGAGNPNLETSLALIPEEQFNVIGHPYTDLNNLSLLSNMLDHRFSALVAKDGMAFSFANKSHADLGTLGDSINSKYICIGECYKSPSGPHVWAGAMAAIIASEMSNDPARPLQTVILKGVLPAEEKDCFILSERNLLLFDGISTHKRTANGEVALETVISTYKKNDAGADDEAYLYVETFYTLSYLRYDWNNYIARKYPRHKLADDGNQITPGQPVMTPNLYKAELINRYEDWQDLGLVENIDAFKASLIVEKNTSSKNRVDATFAPDLMNQFRIGANKVAFIL